MVTAHADSGVVDAVMKMWPPPAAPKDRDPEKDVNYRGSGHVVPQSPTPSSSHEANQPIRISRHPDQPGLQKVLPVPPNPAAVTSNTPRPPGHTHSRKPLPLFRPVQCDIENPATVMNANRMINSKLR